MDKSDTVYIFKNPSQARGDGLADISSETWDNAHIPNEDGWQEGNSSAKAVFQFSGCYLIKTLDT